MTPPQSCPICKVAQDLCVCEEGELSQALESYASGVSVGQPAHSKSEYKRRVAMGDPNVAPPPGVEGRKP